MKHLPITRRAMGIVKLDPRYAMTIITPTKKAIPTSIKAALQDPYWKNATRMEFKALIRNQTWELVPRNTTYHVINNIWIFKVKEKSDGSLSD